MVVVTETEREAGDGSAETVPGFDPETDKAISGPKRTVKSIYERLRGRGDTERAETLRQAETIRDQIDVIKDLPSFDPAHDQPESASKCLIVEVYDELQVAGYEDAAEELRSLSTVTQQQKRSLELRRELLGSAG